MFNANIVNILARIMLVKVDLLLVLLPKQFHLQCYSLSSHESLDLSNPNPEENLLNSISFDELTKTYIARISPMR